MRRCRGWMDEEASVDGLGVQRTWWCWAVSRQTSNKQQGRKSLQVPSLPRGVREEREQELSGTCLLAGGHKQAAIWVWHVQSTSYPLSDDSAPIRAVPCHDCHPLESSWCRCPALLNDDVTGPRFATVAQNQPALVGWVRRWPVQAGALAVATRRGASSSLLPLPAWHPSFPG